ncbi:MAG: DUF4263 domain-containing protein [Oceanicaulis sp.]|nr:DUF4263 domain-containing protein [Oceanicaulis sp.]
MEFNPSTSGVVLAYQSERPDNGWVWRELQVYGNVTLSRVFTFKLEDLLSEPDEADVKDNFEAFTYQFRFAVPRDGYFQIEGRIFDIPNKVLIAEAGLPLSRKLFVAERNISIMRRIAELLPADQDIVIGGDRGESIPIENYQELLRKFPNTTEMNHYAAARVATVVGDYFALMKDAQGRYENYLNKTRSVLRTSPIRQTELLQTELEKYELIKDTISEWLRDGDRRPESDWQKMILNFLLLIFPKYVAILQNVRVQDFYSTAESTRNRYIDIALIDASGNIDVIEVKKPFEHALLNRVTYRDNHTPSKELAGSIMQAEKYLFHLSKWGVAGEKKLTTKYVKHLPPGLTIRITNPKAMIILGRDRHYDGSSALNDAQLLDLEVIKRKYANMMDIMTYDDLLRRLENIIASLRKRVEEADKV